MDEQRLRMTMDKRRSVLLLLALLALLIPLGVWWGASTDKTTTDDPKAAVAKKKDAKRQEALRDWFQKNGSKVPLRRKSSEASTPAEDPTEIPHPSEWLAGETVISGTVSGPGVAEGEAYVRVEGCSQGGTQISPDGSFTLHVEPGRCRLQAIRRDGALEAVSRPQVVTAEAGATYETMLALPQGVRGGIGAQVAAAEGGIEIVGVVPGGAADQNGLRGGDRVVDVDGEPTGEMELRDFIDWVGGDVGTTVTLTVERQGTLQKLTLERQFVDDRS